jgi:hypothetical protein
VSGWADSIKNEELHNVKLERSILRKIKRKTANCWSHLTYELLPKTRYEGKMKSKRGRGRRRKQLLNDLKEKKKILEFESRTKWHSPEKSVCKRLWICRKTDCVINELRLS